METMLYELERIKREVDKLYAREKRSVDLYYEMRDIEKVVSAMQNVKNKFNNDDTYKFSQKDKSDIIRLLWHIPHGTEIKITDVNDYRIDENEEETEFTFPAIVNISTPTSLDSIKIGTYIDIPTGTNGFYML